MTAAITGAAIGFLVWAVPSLLTLGNASYRLVPTKAIASVIAFTGSGAAIGWLIGGGL